jgi:outer membrane protein TolC
LAAGAIGFALWGSPASLPAQISLGTVVDLAQRNASTVKLAEADVRKAEASLAETKDVFIPSLLFSTGLPVFPEVGFTGTPPSIWSASVQSLVFSESQRRYITAAHEGLKSATLSLKDAREQVTLDASTAYIELDTVGLELAAARREEEFSGRLVAIVQERAEAGVDALSDLYQAQLTTAQIRLKRIHLEARAGTLAKQLETMTGLPATTVITDHGSIPEIPVLNGEVKTRSLWGIEAAKKLALSKELVAKGDDETNFLPEMVFVAQYNRNTTLLNDVNRYFKNSLPANNFASGIDVRIPFFDMGHRAKSKESAADALRAKVEAEQAERQNDVEIATLDGSLRELDALAEIAGLKQKIAEENLKTVLAQMEVGNGQIGTPGGAPQISPKAEQLARIEESQKVEESLDAGFDLAKTRLGLLRALGHMGDWLAELKGAAPGTPK